MRSKVLLVLAAVAVAALAGSWPGAAGARGLLRVQDARSAGNWYGTLMLHATHATWPYAALPDSARPYLPENGTLQANEGLVALSLSPVKYFELFAWGGGLREFAEGQDSSFWGYHGINPGLKLSLPLIPVAKLGAMGTYSFYPILDDFRGQWYYGNFGFPLVNGPAWTGLLTLDLRDVAAWTPALHFNYGQAYDSYVAERGVGGDTTIENTYTTLGAALEYPIDKLDLFVEFISQQKGDGFDPLGDNGRVSVTPGLKIGYLRPLIIQGGASIGLNDKTPDLEIIAGLGLTGRIFTPPKPTRGTIVARVVEALTAKPLPATVTLPGIDKPGPYRVASDGTVKVKGVRPGEVVVEAAAPGYRSAAVAVTVAAGRTTHQAIELELLPTEGVIAGIISDAATGAPLRATVSLPGSGFGPFAAGAQGEWSTEGLPAGNYTVEAAADGYLTATTTVQVRAGETATADFELVKEGVEITLKVYFDVDKATLRPESRDGLAAAAKLLKENPGVSVEIAGHTDNTGSDEYNLALSKRRAQAVVDYLVTKHGIDRSRLTVKGYGESKPVATNDTEDGKQLNRRVEFKVLEQ